LIDTVDEAVDEHGVHDGVGEKEPEVGDRVVPPDALAQELAVLMVVVNAAVADLAVVHML